MITTRELARLAGVAPSTVSLALRNDPRVRPATRDRIRALADEHQYASRVHLPVAGHPPGRLIALLIPDTSIAYYARLLRGVLQEAYRQSLHVLVYEVGSGLDQAVTVLDQLAEQGVCGAIVKMQNAPAIPRRVLLRCWSRQTALIGLDQYYTETPIDHVGIDESAVAAEVLDYLMGLGHRRIGFFSIGSERPLRGRALAFTQAYRERKIPTHFLYTSEQPGFHPVLAQMTQLIAGSDPPTAVIGWDEIVAMAVLKAARVLGIRVPQELSIIATGSLGIADFTTPSLTTVESYPEHMGAAAVQLLQKRLSQDHAHHSSHTEMVRVHPRLHIRESCGKAPTP
jgi:LacI family transcriptional regulator